MATWFGFASLLSFVSCFFLAVSAAADTEDVQTASGRVILEVQGSIQTTDGDNTARFDLEKLESLGMVEIRTESPWTDGMATFQGVPISALVDFVGASGSQVRFLALDDYTVTIPISDFDAYQPILATRRDGEPMRIRDRGPIWVIYPWSDYPQIQNEENYAKAIWQVFQMTFE